MDEKEGTRPFYYSTRHINGALLNEPLEKLLKMFWECPIDVVREECLAGIARNALDEKSACWIEERIEAIEALDNRIYLGNRYWEHLLSWYLFGGRGVSVSPFRERTLEFTISLLFGRIRIAKGTVALPVGCELWGKIAKMIASAIRKHPELYWAPSVPEFLEASLAHENWTIVERALYLICRAEDTSFLPRVVELSRKAGEEKEKKEDFKTKANNERFASAKARSVLSEAVGHLLICQMEQNEDVGEFQFAVQDFFYRNCRNSGLREHPNVCFECPEKFSPTKKFFVGVGVNLSHGTWNPDAVCLDFFLEKCNINLKIAFDGIPGFNEMDTGFKKLNGTCAFGNLFEAGTQVSGSTRKVVRLRVAMMYLHNKNGWEEIATLTRYIRRAE